MIFESCLLPQLSEKYIRDKILWKKCKTICKTTKRSKTNGFNSWWGWIFDFAVDGEKLDFCDSWGRQGVVFFLIFLSLHLESQMVFTWMPLPISSADTEAEQDRIVAMQHLLVCRWWIRAGQATPDVRGEAVQLAWRAVSCNHASFSRAAPMRAAQRRLPKIYRLPRCAWHRHGHREIQASQRKLPFGSV